MNNKLVTSVFAMVSVGLSAVFAQTSYTGGNGGQITDIGNWDNGLPTSPANVGTISGGNNIQMDTPPDGYYISHTGGVLNSFNGNWSILNGEWTMSGTSDFRSQTLSMTNQVWTVNGGSFQTGVTVDNSVINFNGGTSTVSAVNFANSGFLTFGGTTAGTVTATNFGTGTVDLRWTSGSLIALTISGADEWAAAQWDSGNMTLDGQDFNDLGTWSSVSGTFFSYDSGTETLTLAVPEPSAFALLAGMLGLSWVMVRRR